MALDAVEGDPVADDLTAGLDELLAGTDAAVAERAAAEAGLAERTVRQPLHTAYVPADRYGPDTVAEWGAAARAAFEAYRDDPDLAAVLDIEPALLDEVAPRVAARLARAPVEDVRVDFEDGYGDRGDDHEDAAAAVTATALAFTRGMTASAGLRIKSLEAPTRARALRTLERFLHAYAAAGGNPAGVVVTLPKVSSPEQVRALSLVCARLEDAHSLAPGALRVELQIELPAAVLGADGTATVARMITAANRRCIGLHYGTYDYSAALGITPAEQRADHPAAEHAKAVLQVAAAGRGVHVVDGSSNLLPVGDRAAVLDAWRVQARIVRRALTWGIGQGWDLHPAQVPCRYLVAFAFLRAGAPAARARLEAYRSRIAAGVLDEPATERALLAYLRRGRHVGALDPEEAFAEAGAGDILKEECRDEPGN
jgi:citrate lyase beta subunit